MVRLTFAHAMLRLMGLRPEYVVRFLPSDPKRTSVRGRTVLVTEDPMMAMACWAKATDTSTEKASGTFYLALETKLAVVHCRRHGDRSHAPAKETAESGGLFSGLPEAPEDRSGTAHPQEADDAAATGTDGAGTGDQHDARAEAAAGARKSVDRRKVVAASEKGEA
jgi:hypothetical protein